jgi:hypothetical protein
MNGLLVLNFEKFRLPIPNRYEVQLGTKHDALITSYLYGEGGSLGCHGQNVLYGIVSYGKSEECILCKEQPIRTEIHKKFELKVYEIEDLNVAIILNDSKYIEIVDENKNIFKIWWEIINKNQL